MISIEDNFEDIIGKAMSGMGVAPEVLARDSGISASAIESLLAGNLNELDLLAVAPILRLDSEKLHSLAVEEIRPPSIDYHGLRCINTPFPVPGYEAMTVNSYLVWNSKSHDAYLFDTGANVDELVALITAKQLHLRTLFLTHTHRDHVVAYDAIVREFKEFTTYTPKLEPYRDAEQIAHGDVFKYGSIHVEARLTNGHSPGGMSYVIHGLPDPIAIVGDSLFSLSMGKANNAYALALKNNREQLLSLPENTILCPGHGPMTTVGFEKKRNPFF